MRHALRALPLVAALAVTSAPALAETVLVFDDTADGFEASVAAETLGFDVVTARNVAGFTTAFDGRDDWDVVVIDLARIGFTTQVADRVDAWLADGGSVIMSYFDMDSNVRARELMDVSCSGGDAYRPLTSTPASGIDVFGYEEVLPSPLNGTSRRADNSDFCSPLGDGLVLASAGADNGIIVSRDGQVIYNAVAPDCFRGTDADSDGTDDIVELYMNQILLSLDLQAPDLLVWGDTAPASVTEYATAYEVEVVTVNTVEALEAAISEEEWLAFYVETQDATAIPAGVVDLFDELDDAGIPVLLFTPTLNGADLLEGIPELVVEPAVDAAPTLTTIGDGLGGVVFRQPAPLDASLPPTIDGAGASYGPLIDGDGSWIPLAATDVAVAMVGRRSGGLIVGSFLPSEYGVADTDDDGIPEIAEFLRNVIDHTRNIGTPAAILTDAGTSPETSLSGAAAEAAGFYPVYYDSGALFADGLNDLIEGEPTAEFVLIENVGADVASLFDGDTASAIATALDDGLPIVVSAAQLDAAPAVADALGVAVGDDVTTPTAVEKNTTHLGRLFALPGPTPSPLTAAAVTTDDAGDELELAAGATGSIAATFAGGGGAIVVLNNGRVIVNGFAPTTVGAADTDSDRSADILQLLRNEIAAVQAPQTLLVLDDGGVTGSVLPEAAQLAGLAVEVQRTAADFVGAFETGTYQQIAIDSSGGDEVLDPAVIAALGAWAADNGGMSLWYDDLSGASAGDLRDLLGVTATDATSARSLVEAADDATGVFVEPLFVPSPIAQIAAPADFGDDLTIVGDGDVAATWAFNRGPAATVFVLGGTAAVNGWAPRNLQTSDLDVNGIEDRVALIANQFVRVGRVPVPVIDVPDTIDEGSTLALDASGSFDPFDETLTFEWDLDDDGDYDDASGPTTNFRATTIDGDGATTTVTFGLRITNESGLRAIQSWTVLVDNVAPTISAGPDRVVNQGATATFTVTINDVPGDTHLVDWDFGDGNDATGASVMHDYEDIGLYDVTVTVIDDDGGEATTGFEVEYRNVAPAIEIGTYAAIDEGGTIEFTATASDPGDDAFAITWDFGDESIGEGSPIEHTFADDGTFRVTGTATETGDPTATRSDATNITVRNVAPTITSTPDVSAPEGDVYAYDVTVTDPGDDTFTYRLDDGPEGMTINEDGELRWDTTGAGYVDVEVAITVTDDDGGAVEQAWTLTIGFADSDEGGAPDTCEALFGFDTDDGTDDVSDPDEDGLTVAEECIAGSDPTVFSGPEAPVLVSPIDGATWVDRFVTLTVENVEDPDGDVVAYDFEIYADEDLTDLVAEIDDVPQGDEGQTAETSEAELTEDTTYWWRARGDATDVTGPWSEGTSFRYNLRNESPGRPVPVAPVGTADSFTPTLRALNADDPEEGVLTYSFDLFAGPSTDTEPIWSAEEVAEGDGGETAVEIDVELEEAALYTWRVRATDDGRPRRPGPYGVAVFEVDTTNFAPEAPVPTSPIDGEIIAATADVTLAWTNATDLDGDTLTYEGALATDEDFAEIIADFNGVFQAAGDTSSVLVREVNLVEGQSYYWRIAANDGAQVSEFGFADFATPEANVAPEAPVAIAPINGATVRDGGEGVELIVQNAVDDNDGDILTYTFEVAADIAFDQRRAFITDVAEGDDGTTSAFALTLSFEPLFWRARAYDGEQFGPWSEVAAFTFEAGAPVEDVGVDGGPDAGPADGGGADGGGTDAAVNNGSPTTGINGGGGCASAGGSAPGGALLAALALVGVVTRRRRR